MIDGPGGARIGSDNAVIARVLADFERFAHGSDLCHCPHLALLFDSQGSSALAFATTFAGLGMAALAHADGTGVSPLIERVVDGEAQVLLASEEQARIVLVVHDGGDGADASRAGDTATFHPRESWRHFLSGRGRCERLRCAEPGSAETRIDTSPLDLGPGVVLHELGPREAMRMVAIDAVLVELRLERRFAVSLPLRRYDRATGRRIEEIVTGEGEKLQSAAVAALGAMGRRDAVPMLTAIAGGSGDLGLRRRALDELCSLDEETARVVAARVARASHDPLQAHAAAVAPVRRRSAKRGKGALPWFG
ncbi:hypothetical protein [Novosphingobium colocasiae]|uniref:hypothetical protein n=1 Tax=Novosphingobium colocasiae TaxID=1256513 RepID=UPI0035B0EC30